MVVVGYDLPSSQNAVRLAEKHPHIWATAGIHPHDAATADGGAMAEICVLLEHPKVVAVGETGLDYFRDLSPREVQRRVLRAHLALARERNRPIILHNRGAEADLLSILRTEGLPEAGGVLHCFSGDEALAAAALDIGLMVSVAGQITHNRADALRLAVATVPLERLMVETDCPYLSPTPYRGHRNEPARVVEVARGLAKIHGVAPEIVAERTTANASRFFAIQVGG